MATVRMTSRLSGSRNGVDWPPIGGTLEVDEAEAADLVRIGLAVIVEKAAPVKAAPVETADADASSVETATAPGRKRRA